MFKLFSVPSKQNDQEEDIMSLGPVDSAKLMKLKNYIINKDFDTFKEFASYYLKNSAHSQCTVSWNHNAIACRCKQCQMSSNSCICVRCFLEGPHKHHSCNIHLTKSGNCDCGDPSGWKTEGFCKRHRIHQSKDQTNTQNQNTNRNTDLNDDDNYFVPDYRVREHISQSDVDKYINLPPELKKRLFLVFKIVKEDIEMMIEKENYRYFTECCQFFMEFTTLGDEIRSCVCESLKDVDFLKKIFLQAQHLDKYKMMEFFHLTGALCGDSNFSVPFSHAASQAIPELFDIINQAAILPFANRSDIPIAGIEVALHFDFQYFSKYPIKVLVSQNEFDWIGIILKLNDSVADFILREESLSSLINFEPVFSALVSYNYILRVIFHLDSEKPKMKQFMIKFCQSLGRFEGFVPTHLNNRSQIYDNYEYILNLAKLPYKLMKNVPYFIPEINDIFIYYLQNKRSADDDKMKNYSLAVLLHQIFIKNLLIFNRKNEFNIQETEITPIVIDDNNDIEDIRKVAFNNCYNGKDPQDTFEYYCHQNLLKKKMINQNQIDTNDENIKELINNIYIKAIDLPMTLIAAHFLHSFKQSPLNMPNNCIDCVNQTHSHPYFLSHILPNLFSLVQVMFSFTDKNKKDDMLKTFSTYFKATDQQLNESSRTMRDFSFIIFLSTLILDRDGINSDYKTICLKNIMTRMKYTTVDQTEILRIISPCTMSSDVFKEKYESMNIENDWNIVIPYYYQIGSLYNIILPSIIEKTQDTILPFPEFINPNITDDNSNNKLNICPNLLIKRLPEVFESKYLFALIYYYIYEYNSDPIMVQYSLNLFITFAENSKAVKDDDTENQSINARNLDDLTLKIPTNNFRIFAKTKVNYKGNQGYSLIQLVSDLGLIGLSALRRVGLIINNVKKSKAKIMKLKKSIRKSLNISSKKFEATIDRKSHDCCSICHKILGPSNNQQDAIRDKFDSEMLYIPVSIFNNVSTELIDDYIHGKLTDKSEKIYRNKVFIRRHLKYKYVHLNCFLNSMNNNNYFLMPKIDHLPFNFLFENGNDDDDDKNDSKSLLQTSKTSSKNSLQISASNHDDRLNLNINFQNITVNGVPMNLNNNQNNNYHRNININLNNDNNNNNPIRLLQNIIHKSSSTFSSSNYNANCNNKSYQSFLMKSIDDFLTRDTFYSNNLEVLSQMILALDHRSRLIPEILDDPMVSTLYSNLFRNCIYLLSLKGRSARLSMQVNDNIDDVILECLKIKSLKMQAKSYQTMIDKEREEYLHFMVEHKEESAGKISFEIYYFCKIVQNKGKGEIELDEKEITMNERLHEYLRRCYLVEKFYLCDYSDVNDLLIDWDLLLDVNYLYHHFYHKKLTDPYNQNLPVYRGVDLPNNFLELTYPPFNINFNDIDERSSLCLFSGTISESDGFIDIRPKHGMPFTVKLNLSGSAISSIRFASRQIYLSKNISSIYVDKNGFQDPGFSRGDNLFLAKEKYYQLIDDFLSGNILYEHE